jgi:hypothetical protein
MLKPSARPSTGDLTCGGATERDGRPLQPHTDVSTTRLHGGLDTTVLCKNQNQEQETLYKEEGTPVNLSR